MKYTKLKISGLLILAVIVFLGSYSKPEAADFLPWKVDRIIGSKAKDFTIKDLEGNDVSLSSFKGKPIVLNFWATWCPYCRKERAELNELHDKYHEKGLVILSISNDRSAKKVIDYLKKKPARFIVLHDRDEKATAPYEVYALPTNLLIDRNGIVRHKFTGFREWGDPESEKLIEELLK